MKKIGALVLSFILLAFSALSISGCSNDGFELVKSVSITTNGEEKTFKSTTTPQVSFTNDKYISYDEFYAAPENRKLYGTGVNVNELSKITISDAIKAAKNATYYEIVEKSLMAIGIINILIQYTEMYIMLNMNMKKHIVPLYM